MSKGHKVFFLDRDGTINVDHTYVHKKEEWSWTHNAQQALRTLQELGYKLVIITNQSGIGHGMYSEQAMHLLHEWMQAELVQFGVKLDAVLYCPHKRDADCTCRKPKTGMAQQAEEKIGEIDYENSWTIGDKTADLNFGKKLGTKTALVKSQYWTNDDITDQPDIIVNSLYEASLAI